MALTLGLLGAIVAVGALAVAAGVASIAGATSLGMCAALVVLVVRAIQGRPVL